MAKNISKFTSLFEFIPPEGRKLLSIKGTEIIQQIGLDVAREVVLDVLTGRNLRDSTEVFTRRRIAALNLVILNLFLRGSSSVNDFVNKLPYLAADFLADKPKNKDEKLVAQWVLGLTEKAFQNVLRDNTDLLMEYRDKYVDTCREVIDNNIKTYGELTGVMRLGPDTQAEINWLTMTYLLSMVGAQTLAIRGSEKSAYGKLFEKLVLGSLLHILDFKYVTPPLSEFKRVFWLSTHGEKRESDAILIYDEGKGVRFDIGFIGRGNPEISLDKVTRFESELSLGDSPLWYMATIIIVDRIGANSKIEELAKNAKGKIIQMSAGFWPQKVAAELEHVLGYKHELVNMEQAKIGEYLRNKLETAPLEKFIAAP